MLKKNKRNVSMNVTVNGQSSVAGDNHDGLDNSQYVLGPDPDLQKEVEIVLPRSNRQSARSRASASGKSRKTVQSQNESRENIVRSRGRPIKPHETEPFLSIDNLPPEKSFVSEKTAYTTPANTSRTTKQAPQTSGSARSLEAQLQRMTAYMSPYNQRTPAPPSSLRYRLISSVLKEETSDNESDISDHGPSIVNGHIHSKNAQSTQARTSVLDQPGVGPTTPTDQNGAKISPDIEKKSAEREENSKDASADSKIGCIATNNSLKNRPKSAPPSGVLIQNRSNVPADKTIGQNNRSKPNSGLEGSRDKNSRSPTRPSSVRSKVSSRGSSRPGTASRPGSRLVMNMMGYRSVGSRTGRVTPANTPFHSPNKQLRQPNHHVKTPFKHSVSKPEMSPDGRMTPSMGMKERTALAAFHVHKLLAVAGEKDGHKTSGKLKKGKLQPLYPVNIQGPKIEQCRGIISEARSYQPSPSRTLQRRCNLIDQIPNVHEYLYERPRTVESVHQTSIASSIDDYDIDGPNTNRSLPDEILYAQEPSNLAPENTFLPEATQEELIARFQAMNSEDDTPRMFATEVGHHDDDDITSKTDLTVSDHIQHELHVSESTDEIKEVFDVLEPSSKNMNNCYSNNIDNDGLEMNKQARGGSSDGRSRLGSPAKSVRFAHGEGSDDNSKEMKQIRNESIAKQQRDQGSASSKVDSELNNCEDNDKAIIDTVSKKNKENPKVSCKPNNDDVIKKDNNDDDEEDRAKDGHGGNKSGGNNSITLGNQTTSGNNGNQGQDQSSNETGKSGTESKDNENPHGLDRRNSHSKNESQNEKQNIRSRSVSRERISKSNDNRSQIRKSQKSAKSTKTKKTDSAGRSRCSKFEQSEASKQHINKLEASSVIHSDRVSVSLRPESPKRNLSRSASPSRPYDQPFQFVAPMSRPCFETPDDFDYYHGNSQRSKVKFLLEGEEPELETIFVENNDDVDIDLDKVITYDVLDTEIAMLRTAIQNSLVVNNEISEEIVESENDIDPYEQEDTETEPDSESETIENETERGNTVRGDYSDILEKYRQKCMERSETYGAISTTLITPRDKRQTKPGQGQTKVRRNGSKSSIVSTGNDESDSLSRPGSGKKLGPCNALSDSGRGSVDNMSEFSSSTSKVSIPKLELGGSTSDLGMESGRSDITVTNDNDLELGDKKEEAVVEDINDGKNLLEIVCDQLTTPVIHDKKPLKRRDLEERDVDVSNLQVVATMKSLSKNNKHGSNTSQKAPFPPLCFTINARPPPGYLYYFAYGPDMNPNRFSSYIQREVKERYWGLLFGFNLVFNKRGTSEEAGGFANIEFNPLRSVEGCIFKITQQELNVLDKCVGYPEHYQHLMLPVWLSNSSNPDNLGVAQYCVPALTFIAQNKWTETEKSLNCDYALSQCIKSADLVSTEYKDSLKSMATQQPITASG